MAAQTMMNSYPGFQDLHMGGFDLASGYNPQLVPQILHLNFYSCWNLVIWQNLVPNVSSCPAAQQLTATIKNKLMNP